MKTTGSMPPQLHRSELLHSPCIADITVTCRLAVSFSTKQLFSLCSKNDTACYNLCAIYLTVTATVKPSVLLHCWLGCRKGIWPVKNEWWGAGMVICLEWCADLHFDDKQLMPLPLTISYFSKIQIGFTFLELAHPGSPGQRAIKRVCVCVTATVCTLFWRYFVDVLYDTLLHYTYLTASFPGQPG